MADFSFLSDSDDEKSAKIILEQASDRVVLEQIAALNCSGFNDSVLPSQLESRFHRLKSLPSVSSKPKALIRNQSTVYKGIDDEDDESNLRKISDEKTGDDLNFPGKDEKFNGFKKNPIGEKDLEPDSDLSDDYFWDSMKIKEKKERKKRDELTSPISLPSSCYSSESLSPPKKSGCFWCSPKKVSKNNNKKSKSFAKNEKNDYLLGELNSYLDKKQQKLMKKAMEEEEKICREAEKIVKLAKQVSSRIEISGIEDDLSDTPSH